MTRRAANPGQRPFMVSGDSLKRIAAAVQSYEHGNRSQSPVRLRQSGGDEGDVLKLCKTTSDWAYDTIATLDVWHDGTPPTEQASNETIEAVNKMEPVASDTFVVVGRAENFAWYLVAVGRDCAQGLRAARLTESSLDDTTETTEVLDGDGPQVLMHHEGCLEWRRLTELEVVTDANIGEDGISIVFARSKVWVLASTQSANEAVITGTECPPPEPPP